MEECVICVEKITSQKRKNIKCEYCDFSACKTCLEKYLITESKPTCMNNECTREWTSKFIADNFSNRFITTDFKKHKENVLFDKEKALLPATQPLVENIIESEKIDKMIGLEFDKIREIHREITRLRMRQGELNTNKNKKEKSKFIKACPAEDCRGFLSSKYKCGICENWTCPECNIVIGANKDAQHTCNPDDIATTKLLANDTKGCPNCGVSIFKIEGCDQMWCTECHTAFSWRTGQIERNIHNPHYYEWMRRTGGEIPRNINEVQCGREIDHQLSRSIDVTLQGLSIKYSDRQMSKMFQYLRNIVREVCRKVIHFRFAELPRFQNNYTLNNQDLRIQYLRNKISEDEFKITLQRNDKKNKKNNDISNIYTLYINTTTDLIYRFCDQLNRIDTNNYILDSNNINVIINILNLIKEMNCIIEYCNECIDTISKTYKCSMSSKKIIPINDNNNNNNNNNNNDKISIDEILQNINNYVNQVNNE